MIKRAVVPAVLLGALMLSRTAFAVDIAYRAFSDSATMGPQSEEFAAKLTAISSLTLGAGNAVRFDRIAGVPAVPAQFGGSTLAAVAAGARRGGFDAAYVSGTDLNAVWGFVYNSGVPFGPRFDEFLGFLYGKAANGGQSTGLELMQSLLDERGAGVVAIPIVASSEQLSGYFPLPLGDTEHERGIGLAGLCQQHWTLRYLPPGQNVLQQACATLQGQRAIHSVNLKFIAAVPGGGSLIEAVKAGQLQGFEFATPYDDVSQVFDSVDNPGTVGLRYVHTPGWQQTFLITWMMINKSVWSALSPAQQALVASVARDHMLSSYGESMQRQGDALQYILHANHGDHDRSDDMVLSTWPEDDQQRMVAATNQVLTNFTTNSALPLNDRRDLATILDALAGYVRANNQYWNLRNVDTGIRFQRWRAPDGSAWTRDDEPQPPRRY